MASSMLPPARPFRLSVHVLPAEASNNLLIEPTRRFLQVTQRSRTLQEFCNEISVKHAKQYGTPLNIKKCQEALGSDLDLEYRLSDVFEDRDVIRVIEAPVKGRFTRADSLFPESSLRPGNSNGAGSKRARSNSVRPPSRDAHRDDGVPNKRQRVLDPDHPVRSLERDLEDDETTLVNGDISPSLQFTASQRFGATVDNQVHMNGIRDSTPENQTNFLSQANLGSPLNSFNRADASPQLPPTRRARSRSQSSARQDDTSSRSVTGQQERSRSQRNSLPNQILQDYTGRGNSISTAATTPFEPVIPNTPDRSKNSKRFDSVTRPSFSLGRNTDERHARIDVYDDIETDTEAPPRMNAPKASSSAQRAQDNGESDEVSEKRRLLEIEKIAKRKLEEEEAAQRGEEAAAQKEQEAAEAKRRERLLAIQKREERKAADEERIRLERQRQEEADEEERKQRQADKDREAKQKEDEQRKERKKEKSRIERATNAARLEAEKVAKAAKQAEEERSITASTPDSESSKLSSEMAADLTDSATGIKFPACKTTSGIWTAELDDLLLEAHEKGQDWADIRKQHFPNINNGRVLSARYKTVVRFRNKFLEKSGLKTGETSTPAKPPATASTSSSTKRRESSTAPIPSNGKVITNDPAALSAQAMATSSPHSTTDVGINSQIPLSAKARRSVSFQNESLPASGQKPSSHSLGTPKSTSAGPNSKKETYIPAPKPMVFSSTPEGSSLKQTKLVSPRLGITGVKSTAKTVSPGQKTPSKLTPKPAIKTKTKTYSLKKQAKLLPGSNIPDRNSPKADTGVGAEEGQRQARSHSQDELAPTNSSSDDASSDQSEEDLNDQSRKSQTSAEKIIAAEDQRDSSAEGSEEDDEERQSRSLSREQSPIRDSRSPVAFMSERTSPVVSKTKSGDFSPSDVSSSPPILEDKASDMEVDDQSTQSEDDDLDQMEVDDEVPTSAQLPNVQPTQEQEMDERLQSQILRESSQRPHYSSQLPSLVAMSKAPAAETKSEAAKQAIIAELENDSEEEIEEESDESSSSSDDDDDAVDPKIKARSAGTDLGGKAGKKKGTSFEAISKLFPKKTGKK